VDRLALIGAGWPDEHSREQCRRKNY